MAQAADIAQTYLADLSRFLFNAIAHPRRTGAIAPSSPWLGKAMASVIHPSRPGRILELGPGTGALTSALVAHGIAPARITAIEYDRNFAGVIAERFPAIEIICGDAFDLDGTLGRRGEKFAAAVSGLPLLNFPVEWRGKLVTAVLNRLEPGAPFVQFSYGVQAPVVPPAGVYVGRAAVVLMNLPPARVWVYRRA